MTLTIRADGRTLIDGSFTEDQVPDIARAIKDSFEELRQYQSVLIIARKANVIQIVYRHEDVCHGKV